MGSQKGKHNWATSLHFQVALVVKNLPANAEDIRDIVLIPGLGWEDPLDEGKATHSSILTWRIHKQKSLEKYSS